MRVAEPYFIQVRSAETPRGCWRTVTVGYDLDCSWEMAALLEQGVEPRLGDVMRARAVGPRELTPEEARAARRELGSSTYADLEFAASLRRYAQLRLAESGGHGRQREPGRVSVTLQELWARLLLRPPSRRPRAGAAPAPAPPTPPRRADRRAHLL